MVVEDLRHVPDVGVIFRLLGPGEFENPIKISADDAHFGRGRWHSRQPAQLALSLGSRLLGYIDLL